MDERDHMLIRLAQFAPPQHAGRLIGLFMGLDQDERVNCFLNDSWFQKKINTAVAIIELQERGDVRSISDTRRSQTPVTPSPSPTKRTIQLPTTPKAKQEANNEPTFYPNISTLTMNPSTPTSSSQASSGRARSTGIRNHGLRSDLSNSHTSFDSPTPRTPSQPRTRGLSPKTPGYASVERMPSFDLRTGTPPKWPYNFSSKEEQGGMKNYAWVVFRGEKPGIYFDWPTARQAIDHTDPEHFRPEAKFGGWKSLVSAQEQWLQASEKDLILRYVEE